MPVRSRKMKKTLESMKVIDERIVVPEGQGGEGKRKRIVTQLAAVHPLVKI